MSTISSALRFFWPVSPYFLFWRATTSVPFRVAAGVTLKPPPGLASGGQRAAEKPGPFPHAGDAQPAAGRGSCRVGTAVVRYREGELVGAVVDLDPVLAPLACLVTLVSASCTIRYADKSTAVPYGDGCPVVWQLTSRPARRSLSMSAGRSLSVGAAASSASSGSRICRSSLRSSSSADRLAVSMADSAVPAWPGCVARTSRATPACTAIVLRLCDTTSCTSRDSRSRSSARASWSSSTARRQLQLVQRRRAVEELQLARAEERLRLSREVHDVVSHSLSTIAVHHGVARLVLATQPGQAGPALSAIETASRSALDELRSCSARSATRRTPTRQRRPRSAICPRSSTSCAGRALT